MDDSLASPPHHDLSSSSHSQASVPLLDAARIAESRVAATLYIFAYLLCALGGRKSFRVATCLLTPLFLLNETILSHRWFDVGFVAHTLFSLVLVKVAQDAIRGDGGPLEIPFPLATVLFVGSSAVLVGDLTHTFYLAHGVIDAVGSLIGGAGLLQQVFSKMQYSRAVALVRSVRQITDPAGFFAIGFVFLRHVHDPQPSAILFHSTLAITMIFCGSMQLFSSFLHSAGLPPAALELSRAMVAFTYLLPSLTLSHLSISLRMNLFQPPSPPKLQDHMYKISHIFHNEEEGMALYLAIYILVAAVFVSLLRVDSSTSLRVDSAASLTSIEDGAVGVGSVMGKKAKGAYCSVDVSG